MPRIHIVGRKNSGKTTLVVALVEHWTARGLRVGTVKHTHHHHELDTPGKDSHRHRMAGAAAVGILAPAMNAIFWPASPGENASSRYDRFSSLLADCDLVLVEGHSQVDGLKVEVWRADVGAPPIAATDSTIIAVVTDDPPPPEVDVPVWSRRDVASLAERLLQLARRVD